MPETKWVQIIQTRGLAGCRRAHRRILASLGLGRIGRRRVLPLTPTIQGMVNKVNHLIKVEPVSEDQVPKKDPQAE